MASLFVGLPDNITISTELTFSATGLANFTLSGAPDGLTIAGGKLLARKTFNGNENHRSVEITLAYSGSGVAADDQVTVAVDKDLIRLADGLGSRLTNNLSADFTIKAGTVPPPVEVSYGDYEFEFRLSGRDLEKEKNLTTTEQGAALTIAEGETLVYYVRLKPVDAATTLPENLTVTITGHEDTDLIFNRSTHYTVEPRQVNKESWKVMSITANPDDDARDDTVRLVHKACCLGDKDFETYAEATLTVTVDEDKRVSPVPPAPVTPPIPPPGPATPEEVDPPPVTPSPEEAEVDRPALVAIYNDSGGEGWNMNDYWGSMEPIDEWYGVITDGEERVVELDLSGNNLVGTVADEVADLSELEKLDLSDNPDLTGELPPVLTDLANLTELYIDGTQVCPPDDDAFMTWLEGLETFRGNDSCDGETEQPEYPVGEVEESGGGCAVASGGAEGSAYSLAFAAFVLVAIRGAKSLRARKHYR